MKRGWLRDVCESAGAFAALAGAVVAGAVAAILVHIAVGVWR